MVKDYADKVHRINYLSMELDSLYHQSAKRLGITDSVMAVLYAVYDAGGECLLSDIYKNSGISKQTVNSAIRNLEGEDILYLKQYKGKLKRVLFTEKGEDYAKGTVGKLYQAEIDAFKKWEETDIETYIGLMEKYKESLHNEIEKL